MSQLAALLFTLVATAGTSSRTLTLEEALATARAHPQLKAAAAQLRASHAKVEQATAGYYPRVDLTAQYQRSTANFVVTPAFSHSPLAASLMPGTSFKTVNVYQLSAGAQATLWDFGKTGGAVDAAEALERAAGSDQQGQTLTVALGVRSAYFNVLAADELVVIGLQTVRNQKKHARQAEQFVLAGTRPKIDLTSAQLNLANAELGLVRAQNQLSLSKVQLNLAMGVEGTLDYQLAPAEIPAGPEALTIDNLLQSAIAARPELARLASQSQQLEAQRRIAKAGYYPAFVAATNFSTASVDSFPFGFNWFIGAGLSWNLFAGFLTQQQVVESEASLDVVDAQVIALRQGIRSEIEQQLLAIDEALHRMSVADRARATAAERLRLAEGRYEAGSGDVIELDDAQVGETNAKAQAVQARYDLSIARARLARAIGKDES